MGEPKRRIVAFGFCALAATGCLRAPDGPTLGSGADVDGGQDATVADNFDGDGDAPAPDLSAEPVPCGPDGGLLCTAVSCPDGGTTTLHGVVYDPAGRFPLRNVGVYVPASPLMPIPQGASCGSCSAWFAAPAVAASTDTKGQFTLTGLPVGDDVPLVVQLGKWRMTYRLGHVAACRDNDAAALAGVAKLRLPRNHLEGDLPNIAVSTGAGDSLECLFHRIGVDDGEFTGDPAGAGRIKIFTGGDATIPGHAGAVTSAPTSKPSYEALWNSAASMSAYDLVLLACEGSATAHLDDAARGVLTDYANGGGRVFASHEQAAWFTPTGPFSAITPPLATWTAASDAVGNPGAANDGDIVTTSLNGQPFPAGIAMKTWLANAGALTNGKLPIYYAHHDVDVGLANSLARAYIALDPSSPAPNATQYLSFGMPAGAAAAEQCGRVDYSELHVSGGAGANADPTASVDYPTTAVVPSGCADRRPTAQEKALEFMLFDLSACTALDVAFHPPAL